MRRKHVPSTSVPRDRLILRFEKVPAMNPEIIYSNFRDEALARLFSADRYTCFAAMPFRGRFSYNPDTVLSNVIQRSAALANEERTGNLKIFCPPETTQKGPPTANVITEEIVKAILFSTFFIGDLTGGNPGVLIETGIAMSFKPTTQIILITQDPLDQLHFDIRNNRIVLYGPDGNIETIKQAFLAAGRSFENDRSRYVTQVSRGLSADAIQTLHCYAAWYQDERSARGQPGLWYPDRMPPAFNRYNEQALNLFQLTLLELYQKRMIWTDYSSPQNDQGNFMHSWAVHCTKIGWLLIKHLWPQYTDRYCERIF
jgi:hypothetical protein